MLAFYGGTVVGAMFLASKPSIDLGLVCLYLKDVGASISACVTMFKLRMFYCSSKYPFYIFASFILAMLNNLEPNFRINLIL